MARNTILATLAVFLAAVAVCLGAPTAEIKPVAAQGGLGDGIIGVWFGSLNIAPYSYSPSSGYTCITCNPVQAPSILTFGSNFLMINITGASGVGCSVNTQGYVIYNLRSLPTPNYYSGTLYVEGSSVPVCFYMDVSGTFTLAINGQGTCPTAGGPATCTPGWMSGTVSQQWGGPFRITNLPQGRWAGSIGIVPYQSTSSGAQCTTCSPIGSNVVVTWSANTLTIAILGGRSGSCTLNAQTAYIAGVSDYAGYPYYYNGYFVVSATQSVPVCFLFDYSRGTLVLRIDGAGGCPRPTDPASCAPGVTPGTVVQTWYATVRLQ